MARFKKVWFVVALVALASIASACGKNEAAPSDTTTTEDPGAAPTTNEVWDGVVPVSGSAFYSFSVGTRGTVNVTLTSVGGQFVPATVTLGLAIGAPSGQSCSADSPTNARAGSSPQVTGVYDPGLYCVAASDVGNLFAPATISVAVDHP